MPSPHGYHITFGTYGARLHGSDKPHVDRDHNEYGTPFPQPDPEREEAARGRMKQDPVTLSLEQRRCVEESINDLARRYRWPIHALAPQSDHTHVVSTANRDGPQLRDALKATATRALNKQFGKKQWWAEGGSAKYLWEWEYFVNARDYVRRQRDW
jgi:REP element-mobilizing transposase RayT